MHLYCLSSLYFLFSFIVTVAANRKRREKNREEIMRLLKRTTVSLFVVLKRGLIICDSLIAGWMDTK